MGSQAAKPPCLLLHGALGSADQVADLASGLGDSFEVYRYNFPGHGGLPIPAGGLDMGLMRDALVAFLEQNFHEPVWVFGYSMGGYVAMSVASTRPELIRGLITLGTKWEWSPEIAAKEVKMLDPAIMAEKVPALVELLKERHAPTDWLEVVEATAKMLKQLGAQPLFNEADLKGINMPIIILRGSADRMVSDDESIKVVNLVRHGQYAELPDQKHPFEQVNLELLTPWFQELIKI
jgi:pimeloyl-ACP methyl ester carboxylesterase